MIKQILSILSSIILFIPVVAWSSSFAGDFSRLSLYLLFPLLGMLAFSIMWMQVVVSFGERWFSQWINIGQFLARSGLAVVVLFVAHPLLAVVAQFAASRSLNPLSLVPQSQQVFILLALIAFSIFLLFELTLRWKNSTIQRIKPIVEYASYLGIILVWIHSLNIGSHTQAGFLKYLWWFYGISASLMILSIFWRKISRKITFERTKD